MLLKERNITFESVKLATSKSGLPVPKVVGEDGIERPLHSLYDPLKEAQGVVNKLNFKDRAIIVVLGLGAGYHLRELRRRYPEATLVVVEALSEIYEFGKKQLPEDERGGVIFLVSETSDRIKTEITRIQIKKGMPPVYVFKHSPSINSFPSFYQPIVRVLDEKLSFKAWERLRYRKFKSERLTILLINFQYFLNKEMENTIKRLGHNLVILKGTIDDPLSKIMQDILKAIIQYKPDFILTINHLGFDEEGILAELLNSIEMPVAIWYVDSPRMIIRAYRENVKPNKVLFMWERFYVKEAKKLGFEHAYYLPLATDDRLFFPMKRKKLYEVGFVGNSMIKPSMILQKELDDNLKDIIKKYSPVVAAKRMTFKQFMKTVDDEVRDRILSRDIHIQQTFEAALIQTAAQIYRLNCVRRLKGFNTVISGDELWETVLDKNSFHIIPPRDYYRELNSFYNSVCINFNSTNVQMPEAVNQRVFDVPASGGFLITDYQRSLEELFDTKKEMVTYTEPDEIPEIVRFYLQNESARKRISRTARERVLRQHTYIHRVKRIIETMKRIFS